MRKLLPLATLVVGLVVGVALGRSARPPAKPAPDVMEPFTLSRIPGGEPAKPSPNGGKFVPFVVTRDGAHQTFMDRDRIPAGPHWLYKSADERVVKHLVQVE